MTPGANRDLRGQEKQPEKEKQKTEQKKRKKKLKPSEMFRNFMEQMGAATEKGDYAETERVCIEAIKVFPNSGTWYYNLACAHARQGFKEKALTNLEKSVVLGFRDTEHIQKDPDLESIRNTPEFEKIIEKAKELQKNIVPSKVKNGIALVSAANTVVDFRLKVLYSMFKLPDSPPTGTDPVRPKKGNTIRRWINTWFKEGTASGNHGDYYDNRDGKHSKLRYRNFSHLTRIEYDMEMQARGFDIAMSAFVFFNGNVVGNASMAGHRSIPRSAQLSPRIISIQYLQYLNNHIYIYPEHRDHDPFEDKNGRGDTFPANTPYVIISQGSSGSDRPFMNAVIYTLAAFHPEVKKFLSKNNLLMPTIQMIFRSTLNTVEKPGDYLTGKAHPTVFRKDDINLEKMVVMAHEMNKDYVPPIIHLSVVEEDKPVVGRDYFDPHPDQALFTTPCAIARIMRSKDYMFRIIVSAVKSRDLNNHNLTFHWVVLRGAKERIIIKKLNERGSLVELLIPYHTRKPVPSMPEIESPRVDIAAFAHNGEYYSAPGFVTFFFLDHEKRTYDENNRILVMDYHSESKNYVDSMISAKKNWRDEYMYDADGRLTGWKRYRGELFETFTSEGLILVTSDEHGRPLKGRKVEYNFKQDNRGTRSDLKQKDTEEFFWYWYDSPKAREGKLVSKEEYEKLAKERAPKKAENEEEGKKQ